MKHIYLPLTFLAAMLGSQQGMAQTAKPQPEKVVRLKTNLSEASRHNGANEQQMGGGIPDDCASALVLTVGATCSPVTVSAAGATQSIAPIACNGFTSSTALDTWVTFVATSQVSILEVLGIGNYDAVLQIFTGSCGSLTAVGCVDNTFPPNSTLETATITTTIGSTYFVRIYNYTPPVIADNSFTVCVYSGQDPPPNDECTGAVAQSLAAGSTVTFTGDNTGATNLVGTAFDVVWEAFTTTECTNVTINYCVPGSVFDDFLVNITTGCPEFLNGLLTGTVGGNDCTLSFSFLAAGTYYIPVLVDAALTPIGPYTISVSAVACPPGYCEASATECDEYIARVQFGSIDNSSGCADGPSVDYTAISTQVTAGSTVPITVTNGPDFYSGDQVVVWIDWNQNQSFLDAGEAYTLTSANLGQSFTGNVSVPLNALPGATVMRIRLMWTGTPSPCGSSAYGEVEDYTVIVNAGIACDANAGTLSGGGTVCFEDGEATLSATASGNAIVPAGFSTVYVLTQGAGLVIVQTNATPEFTVGAVGNYTIHTLVYDANTLDLGIVVPGVTTGFDVNSLLVQGGGTICASLDVAGAAFSVVVCGSYCDAGASGVGLGLDERIVNVTFAGINNNSPNVTPVAPAYSDFTSVVGNVVVGQSYPIAVDVNRTGANTSWSENQVLVWIDLNQNGSFQDAGELVFTSQVGSVDIYLGNISIPLGSSVGATRMRIRLHDVHNGVDYINNFNNTPCGLASYGEVEDYTVVIDFTSSVDEQTNKGFSIFPNPGDGNLNVLYGGVSGRASMEVYDMTGRILHSDVRQLNNGEHSTLSLSGRLAAGTYILRLTNEQGSMEQRFVVQ